MPLAATAVITVTRCITLRHTETTLENPDNPEKTWPSSLGRKGNPEHSCICKISILA